MSTFASLLPYFFTYGYVALFVIFYFSAAYLPLPANIALIGAGALSHFSYDGVHFNILIAGAVSLLGNVLGDLTGYAIARHFGNHRTREQFEKRHKSLRKIERLLKEHPIFTIGVTRLIGFASPLVNTFAGYTKLRADVFVLSDLVGNIIYTILYIGAGYIIGSVTNDIVVLGGIATGILTVVTIAYIGAFFYLERT